MWRHIKPILKVIILATAMLVSSLHSRVLENTTKCYVTFYLVHTTIQNYNWIDKNISTHTWMQYQILPWSKSKFKCFLFFLYTTLYKIETKRCGKLYMYRCVLHHANPLSLINAHAPLAFMIHVLQCAWSELGSDINAILHLMWKMERAFIRRCL